jgi:hypothetical protein
MLPFEFPQVDRPILDLLFKYDSAVYGGYLRDLVLGVEPNDIDAVSPEMHREELLVELKKLYNSQPAIFDGCQRNETLIFRSPGLRELELFFVDDDPEKTIISSVSSPDFSVNLLNYTVGDGLINWVGDYFSVDEIIEMIKKKVVVVMDNPDQYRMEKILRKGFAIEER